MSNEEKKSEIRIPETRMKFENQNPKVLDSGCHGKSLARVRLMAANFTPSPEGKGRTVLRSSTATEDGCAGSLSFCR